MKPIRNRLTGKYKKNPRVKTRRFKKCPSCKKYKLLKDYIKTKLTSTGLGTNCKKCHNIYTLKFHHKNRLYKIKKMKNYCQRIKEKAILGYGDKCKCCGESQMEFLTLDHIKGNGAKHRLKLFGRNGRLSGGYKMHRWVINNNFPKMIQVLCYNCNCAKGVNKYCPHET